MNDDDVAAASDGTRGESPHGLGRNVALYAAATIAAQSVSLLTTPVFSRHFGPSRFAVLDVVSTVVALALVGVGLGVDSSLQARFVKAEARERRTVVVSALVATVVPAVVLAVALAAASAPLSTWLFDSERHRSLLATAAATIPLTAAAQVVRGLLRIEERAAAYLVNALVFAGVGGVGAVVFAVPAGLGLPGVYVGLGLGALTGLVAAVCATSTLRPAMPRASEVRALVRLGWPLVPAAAAGWALRVLDRFVLVHHEPFDRIGHYAIAARLAGLLSLASLAFAWAWTPRAIRLHATDPDVERARRPRAFAGVLALALSAGVGLSLTAREAIELIAGRDFVQAVDVLPPLVLGFAIAATAAVPTATLLAVGDTRPLATHGAVAAVIAVGGYLVLIPPFGIAGAAWATVAGYTWQAIAYERAARAASPARSALPTSAALVVVALPFVAAGWLERAWLRALAAVALALVAAAVAWWMARRQPP